MFLGQFLAEHQIRK